MTAAHAKPSRLSRFAALFRRPPRPVAVIYMGGLEIPMYLAPPPDGDETSWIRTEEAA